LYDLETDRVSREIAARNAKRVLLQLPDGLRPHAFTLVSALKERTGSEVFLVGDSCYGACDLALEQAKVLKADLLVHYGHSQFLLDTDIPVLYIEARIDIDAKSIVGMALPLIEGWGKVGLATTVQHANQLGEVKRALELQGIQAVVGRGAARTPHEGQVIGCDYSSARAIRDDVDGFLFIGGGRFHSLGLALSTGKPVVVADTYLQSAKAIGEDEIRRHVKRRMAAIAAAAKARRLGIIVSLKPGQFEPSAAESVSAKLEAKGKEATIICLDEVRAETLLNFSEAEAFIDLACPRIAIDGVGDLRKPLLTLQEALVMLGEVRWDEVWGGSFFARS